MKYAKDGNGFIIADKVSNPIVAKKQNPNHSVFFFPKNVADFRKSGKNLCPVINASDDLLRGNWAII